MGKELQENMRSFKVQAWAAVAALSVCSLIVLLTPSNEARKPEDVQRDSTWLSRQRTMLSHPDEETYALVIDAGSSGSRVHVYKLKWQEGKDLPEVDLPDKKLKTTPGLSTFNGKEKEAGAALSGLVKFAKENIPEDKWGSTPVILSATAGLRMLDEDVQKKIMDSCYEYLKSESPFMVERRNIAVISGKDEGAFGWLSINFLMKRLKGMENEHLGTVGGVEMGGASAQVTFLQTGLVHKDDDTAYFLKVGNDEYPLYTHSYLGFGQEEARHKVNELMTEEAEDPCMPVGYQKEEGGKYQVYDGRDDGPVVGTGDAPACKKKLEEIMEKRVHCEQDPCAISGVHQPDFAKEKKQMVLFENFFHSAMHVSMPDLEKGVTPKELEEAGRQYCAHTWEEVLDKNNYPNIDPGAHTKYCFSLLYLSTFLSTGLNVPEDQKYPILGNVGGTDIEWALGEMLMKVMSQNKDGDDEANDSPLDKQKALQRDMGITIEEGPLSMPADAGMGWGAASAGMIGIVVFVVALSYWQKGRQSKGPNWRSGYSSAEDDDVELGGKEH